MGFRGVDAAASVFSASKNFASGGSDDTVGSIIGDEAESKIKALLGKAWDKAREKLENNPKLVAACTFLERGLGELLGRIKGLIFNSQVLGQLVPFYGNVKGIIDGAIQAIAAHGHRTAMDTLNDMGPAVASGVATEALSGFTTYVKGEFVRTAVKSAYTFAKSIGGLLAEIFSFGAWSVVSFVTAIIEAIVGFVNSLVQGMLFDRATEKFKEYSEARSLPTPEEFRTVLAGCSFVGCVFFASANYVGHFNLTSVLAQPQRVLSTKMITDSVGQINEAQKMACQYTSGAAFKLSCRKGAEDFKWVLKMIEGYSSDVPKSEFLTADATKWQRFKHSFKKIKNKLT